MRLFYQKPAGRPWPSKATQEMADKVIEIEYQEEEEDEAEKEDEEGDDADEDGEQEDDAEEQQQKQPPPRKVTRSRGGQMREYNYLKSVKSVEELDKLRFKNYCVINGRKALPTFTTLIMQCTRKRRFKPGIQCHYELLALRLYSDIGIIDVYAHSEHNHPIVPEGKRAIKRSSKKLMSAENPPRIFRTPDNIKWTFFRTFVDYEQMQQFRRKSGCAFIAGRENHRRVRHSCNRNCQFKLLALKNTRQGYHVYTFGEHNHPAILPKKKQQLATACAHQQKQQEMEVDDEEKEEEEDEAEKEDEGRDEAKQEDEQEEKDDAEQQQKQPPRKIAKVYKLMAGIEPNQIGPTLEGWKSTSLLKMVEMADREIRQHPAKFDLWHPWLKCAIKKCIQIEGFGTKYTDLIILMMDHD